MIEIIKSKTSEEFLEPIDYGMNHVVMNIIDAAYMHNNFKFIDKDKKENTFTFDLDSIKFLIGSVVDECVNNCSNEEDKEKIIQHFGEI